MYLLNLNNNRKSVRHSNVNDALHSEITNYMVNLPPSSDNAICILPQKLILFKAYQQWVILDSTEEEHVTPNTRIRMVGLAPPKIK